MKFEELIKDRYSCRKFKNTPVEKEKIEKILEAALVAPTACNLQPQRILVLTDKNIIKALDDEKCTRYIFDAPLILLCVLTGQRLGQENTMVFRQQRLTAVLQ